MTNEEKPSKASKGDSGQAEVQSKVDEENAKGYSGIVPDPTPNFNYTVAGNDAPTPETDNDLADDAAARQRAISRNVNPDD